MNLENLSNSAQRYALSRGQSRPRDLSQTVIAPQHQDRLASLYKAAPEFDHRALPAYRAMREETGRQFDLLTGPKRKGGLGVHVDVRGSDPYPDAGSMLRDLQDRGRLGIMSSASTGGHPFFSNDENDQFRAVHDAFGHAATGRGFDRHGEEAAYQSHASMYSPLARRALATETRGQNAAMIHAGGVFPQQKIALLSGASGGMGRIGSPQRRNLLLQAAQFHTNAGLGK